jgi:HSP20 family protein
MNTMVKCGYRPMFPSFFDEVFESAANDSKEFYYKPAANVTEDETGFKVELALPGFEKEEISMKLEKNLLSISAGREKNESDKDIAYTTHEFGRQGKYLRSFILPETVNVDGITAEYRNGVLKVFLPKKETVPAVKKDITIA